MSTRREPNRTATRKPADPLIDAMRRLDRAHKAITWGAGILVTLERLQEVEDAQRGLLVQAVAVARHQGKSWAEIGASLGVSKQAAHERFSSLVN